MHKSNFNVWLKEYLLWNKSLIYSNRWWICLVKKAIISYTFKTTKLQSQGFKVNPDKSLLVCTRKKCGFRYTRRYLSSSKTSNICYVFWIIKKNIINRGNPQYVPYMLQFGFCQVCGNLNHSFSEWPAGSKLGQRVNIASR